MSVEVSRVGERLGSQGTVRSVEVSLVQLGIVTAVKASLGHVSLVKVR